MTLQSEGADLSISPHINVQCAFVSWMTLVELTFSWELIGVYRKIKAWSSSVLFFWWQILLVYLLKK
jgi:hypothetical protein